MCTVSIRRDEAGNLRITMNRDENLSRGPEVPPMVDEEGVLCPRDSVSGGTWTGAHAASGRWACLLNGYSDYDKGATAEASRGEIIPQLLTRAPEDALTGLDAKRYHSFRLLYGDREHVYEAFWNGEALAHTELALEGNWLIRSSSSWMQPEVIAYRTRLFDRWRTAEEYLTQAAIPSFHTACEVGEESSAVLMRREGPARATTSIVTIAYAGEQMQMHYASSQRDDAQTVCPLALADITDERLHHAKA